MDVGSQIYFEGDFWDCVIATVPGESPATAPQKWRKVPIPAVFMVSLVSLAVAKALEIDGQTDKALAKERSSWTQTERIALTQVMPDERLRTRVGTR